MIRISIWNADKEKQEEAKVYELEYFMKLFYIFLLCEGDENYEDTNTC